jgi:hypothetical protein
MTARFSAQSPTTPKPHGITANKKPQKQRNKSIAYPNEKKCNETMSTASLWLLFVRCDRHEISPGYNLMDTSNRRAVRLGICLDGSIRNLSMSVLHINRSSAPSAWSNLMILYSSISHLSFVTPWISPTQKKKKKTPTKKKTPVSPSSSCHHISRKKHPHQHIKPIIAP